MGKISRQWFLIGNQQAAAILIDFELQTPVAHIETSTEPRESIQWTPNQESGIYRFVAHALGESKEFSYDPHSQEATGQALIEAMEWAEGIVGPPVKLTNSWVFYLKALMVWRYEAIWKDGKIIALNKK